jgi:hypothetical protein
MPPARPDDEPDARHAEHANSRRARGRRTSAMCTGRAEVDAVMPDTIRPTSSHQSDGASAISA